MNALYVIGYNQLQFTMAPLTEMQIAKLQFLRDNAGLTTAQIVFISVFGGLLGLLTLVCMGMVIYIYAHREQHEEIYVRQSHTKNEKGQRVTTVDVWRQPTYTSV